MAKEKLTNEQMELIFDTMENIYSGDIGLQEGVDKLRKNGMNKQFPASDELIILRYISCYLRWFMQDDGVYNLYKKLKNGEPIDDN